MTRWTSPLDVPPLVRWSEERRVSRNRRRELPHRTLLLGSGGISLLILTIAMPSAPRLIWNASASVPLGLYGVTPGTSPIVGDMVVSWPPEAVRSLASSRHYLPKTVPLIKRVAAGAGNVVCARGPNVTINGREFARRLARDGNGRPLPWWCGCRLLQVGEYFLGMAGVATSFDGRYFGVTIRTDIIGKARPLWTR